MDELIYRLEKAFVDFDATKSDIPVRAGFHYEKPEQGLVEWMPIHNIGDQVVVKMVAYHPNNPEKFNWPTIVSSITSYDTRTGHLKSIIDGVFLTALRTGAASAIASRYLAKNDSKTLGLIGCGAQAVTQFHAISRVFELETVLLYDVDLNAMNSFAENVKPLNQNVQFIASDIKHIIAYSDIVTTATSIKVGEGPLFENCSTKPWLHINAVGSDFPGKIEVPLSHLKKSYVCPDFIGQALIEGECQQLNRADIKADLFQVIKDKKDYESLKTTTTVFDSTGIALEDQVVADLFLEYAAKLGLGKKIEIEIMSSDSKNPYDFLNATKDAKITKLV